MKNHIVDFLTWSVSEQIRFLKEGEFVDWSSEERISFLKQILRSETSSKTLACGLKILRQLKYRDRFFFRKFLYHVDSSVSNAARKAIGNSRAQQDSGIVRMVDLVRRESPQNRPAIIRSLFRDVDSVNESMILSLLQVEDFRVREEVVARINPEMGMDETILVEALSGAVWYVRSAVLDILGRRRSPLLTELAGGMVDDSNAEVRMHLVQALEMVGGEEVIPFLDTLSGDGNHWVRKSAAKSLDRLKQG